MWRGFFWLVEIGCPLFVSRAKCMKKEIHLWRPQSNRSTPLSNSLLSLVEAKAQPAVCLLDINSLGFSFHLQTLLEQSSSRLEEKCQFLLHRVYIKFNLDDTTLYHAVKSLSADSYIRSSKSGNIMIRKKWKVDCGVWLHFQDDHSCS